MKKFYCTTLLILIIALPSLAQSLSKTQEESIGNLVSKFMEQSMVPGMAVSISYKGDLIYSKGFGYSNLELNTKVVPAETKFRIASISKTLTADAIVQLVESGNLDLDAPVQKYVPSFPKKAWSISTRQLAGHLGGIRHYRGQEFMSSKHYSNVSQGLAFFKDDSLLHKPGTKYRYSSYGFNLISAVIEGSSNMDYLTYMQLNVFDKLKMNSTVPEIKSKIIKGRGGYYNRTSNLIVNEPYVDNSYKWAGGGFLSTSEDLILFAQAHQKAGYLTSTSLMLLVESQKTNDGKKTNYGIGWTTTKDNQGHYWVGHSGGAIGGTSKLVIYPDEEIIIVVLTNMSDAKLGELPHQLGWELMK